MLFSLLSDILPARIILFISQKRNNKVLLVTYRYFTFFDSAEKKESTKKNVIQYISSSITFHNQDSFKKY